jgi:proteasome lid subunit RPN8/RPN11
MLHAWFLAASLTITNDERLMRALSDMVLSVATRPSTEAAAFITCSSNGTFDTRRWPITNYYEKQVFNGALPADVVAIVHTHPPYSTARPSPGDIAQAKRLGMPVYVLTRWSIYFADASGNVIRVVEARNWVSDAR